VTDSALLRLALPPTPQSARRARHAVTEFLAGHGHTGDLAQNAALLTSETVTNAVLHAHTDVTVTARVDGGTVRVAVDDSHPGVPVSHPLTENSALGRGLAMIEALAADYGVDLNATRDGKTVWFRVGGPPPAHPPSWDTPDGWTGPPTPTARLARVPVELFRASHHHWSQALRELVLHDIAHGTPPDQDDAGTALALLSAAVDRAVDADPTASRVDAAVPVDPTTVGAFGALQDALDRARDLAVAGNALTRPPLPEVVAFRDWCCEQAIAQFHGVPAQPWAGTDALSPAAYRATVPPPVWDARWVARETRPVLAADDSNRILAASPAAEHALGWPPGALVGQRITAIVPARLREAHVTGFTRHLVTGQARLLGRPATLTACAQDGTETDTTVVIEARPAGDHRTVYLAWFDGRGPDPA
jgi:anti-sigma regulatory factor (Ser/Thr protein kinase)/PAS domain-containing protein